MKRPWLAGLAFAGWLSLLAIDGLAAQPASLDGIGWLGRIAAAAQKLNYVGTFTYSNGAHAETSRITHIVVGGTEKEKLEVLDGSPREVIRTGDEVKCYLPLERLVIIDQAVHRRAFPARLNDSLDSITENYTVSKGETQRVAGRESQLLILKPKDELRYGHMLWADVATGLLLRSRMVNDRNEPVEQFSFTDVAIGGQIGKDKLKPKFSGKSQEWRVVNARATESPKGEGAWVFQGQLPGYQQSALMRRQLKQDRPDAYHIVFSDGLAAISVFIEPAAADHNERVGLFVSGPFNVYKRPHGDHMLTVLGEVPMAALKRVGDGIEERKQ
jgi:sigma-E factor negative regulatory protein RseB